MTVLVVLGALFRVGKHLVRLIDLLEFFFRFLIVGIDVGMVFTCERTIRLFDICGSRILGYAQHFIIISFFRHGCLGSFSNIEETGNPLP